MEHNKVRVKIFNILLFWWNLLRLIAEPIDDWMVSYVLVQMSYISKSVTYSPRMKDNIDIDNQERTPLQPRLMHLLEKSKALGGVICVHGAITQQWLSFLISPIAMTLNGQALVSVTEFYKKCASDSPVYPSWIFLDEPSLCDDETLISLSYI